MRLKKFCTTYLKVFNYNKLETLGLSCVQTSFAVQFPRRKDYEKILLSLWEHVTSQISSPNIWKELIVYIDILISQA